MEAKNLAHIFKRLGMSKHAWTIYEYILKNSSLSASDLIAQSGIHRPAAYKALFELLDAKLVRKTPKGKRFLWETTNSERVLELFQTETKLIEDVLPKTRPDIATFADNPVRVLHGEAGVRAIFDDVIDHTPKGETFYRYTSEQDLHKVNSYLSTDYRQKRDKKHLERLVISNPQSGKQKRPRLERFIKTISEDMDVFNQNIIQLIYGNRLAFIDLNTLEGMIIENAALAEFQKVIFKQLYKKLPET